MEQDPLIGNLIGTYLIQSHLGEGGMARVYKAYHTRLQRDVAIKIILSEIANHAEFQERFAREARIIARLEHPNIVAVYDFGEINNLTYLVMQYVGGGTLREQLQEERPIDPRRAGNYAEQMAHALHQAHQRGIVHRDVKPQNMLISASNPQHLLLSDFGIAKLFASNQELTRPSSQPDGQAKDTSLTSFGQIIGTLAYIAPEQVTQQPIDARTDVYALGAVLFQMLTGQLPFQASSAAGLMYQHAYVVPRSVREINPSVSEKLAQITAKALEKLPAARFQTAEEMAQALHAALAPPPPLPNTAILPPGSFADTTAPLPYREQLPGVRSPSSGSPLVLGTRQIGTPTTTAESIAHAGLFRKWPKWLYYLQTILVIILIIGAVTFTSIQSPNNGKTPPTSLPITLYKTDFTENFQNNNRVWPNNNGGFTGTISNQQYTISVNDGQTYVPYPSPEGTTQGPLPTNFTLTADIIQNTGDTGIFYGLTFRVRKDGGKVSCYALLINETGQYEISKYNAGAPIVLSSGTFSAIHTGLGQDNTLQVSVKNTVLSFKINDLAIPINSANTPDNSITDTSLTGGQLGLLVAGPGTRFILKFVKFSIPL
jgi:serine/threonine protein kinase